MPVAYTCGATPLFPNQFWNKMNEMVSVSLCLNVFCLFKVTCIVSEISYEVQLSYLLYSCFYVQSFHFNEMWTAFCTGKSKLLYKYILTYIMNN